MRDVVITGVGLVTPLGDTLDELREAFLQCRSAVRAVPGHNGVPRVAAVVDREYVNPAPKAMAAFCDRVALFALVAGGRAIADSGLDMSGVDASRFGLILGNAVGPSVSYYESYKRLIADDVSKPASALRCTYNAAASHVSIQYGLRGRCSSMSSECASSSTAFADATRLIRHGYQDLMLVGASEAPMGEGLFRGWESLRMLAKPDPDHPERACQPFSKNRTGLVLGEGAALFVLESGESARARGARILARVLGCGESSDAKHLTLPDLDGQVRAMRTALKDAGLAPTDIDYINAHGTATQAGDIVETRSVREAFGSHADALAMSSTKSMHGHLLAASGAVETAAMIVALRDGVLPPTAHLDQPDPECDLDYVANAARTGVRVRAAMCNSFGFGGSNACLILGQPG